MDMYSPSTLRGMSPKQLKEARAEIMAEIADLEGTERRSSLQEIGLRNLRASLEIVDDLCAQIGDGSFRPRSSGASDGRLLEDPMTRPDGSRPREDRGNERFMTYRSADGQPVYAVGRGQRMVDIPGMQPIDEPHALGQVIRAAITGNRQGLSAPLRAAVDESNGTNYHIPSVLSAEVIDLARAQSVLMQSGMRTIALAHDGIKIARVLADAQFHTKIKNDDFVEYDAMRFGAITIVPKMVGCLVRVALEDVEDAPNFAALIEGEIAKAFATSIDNYGINGVAGGQAPRGIFSFDEINDDPVAASALGWLSLSAMALKVKNRNHTPTAAMMSVTREHALLESVDGEERWLGAPPTLAGVSMLSSTQVPNTRKIIGDFTKFALGLRTGLQIDFTDIGAGAFEKRQRVFRVYWRGQFALLDETAFQTMTITG